MELYLSLKQWRISDDISRSTKTKIADDMSRRTQLVAVTSPPQSRRILKITLFEMQPSVVDSTV